ncbi:MAG: hypothetical protein J5910_01435 [Lachnospiraceae bacterium]|nr:hypothetical protein [Lachnospiraceae bacterium]
MENTVKQVHLLPAQCALDLGDGSERGEYVCQEYVLNVLGRPHRAVNIMYTYYPNDKEWPKRISEACADMDVSFAWDYPYDDYFPFCEDGEQFEQMRDIRRHGQDVMLTITMDCSLDDDRLRAIARKLSTFGRVMLRINHECNGNWFTHNRRFSYDEIADFFVRFAGIIKAEAPNVRTVFCAGLVCDETDENGQRKVELEDTFAKAYMAADVWSADKYLALHYGWPYGNADETGKFTRDPVEEVFNSYAETYERLSKRFGSKPFIQAELNADGDVTGPLRQQEPVLAYYDLVKKNNAPIAGISMYQFRDRGRLGLERQNPNEPTVGIRQPLMDGYLKVLSDPYFSPGFETGQQVSFPAKLRWGGSEDADGIEIQLSFTGMPQFCEMICHENLSLMIEFNGKWFYKSPQATTIDLMSAFFDHPITGSCDIPIRIFATCPDGENHEGENDDWNINAYFVMEEEPEFRIRYEVPYDLF